MKTSEILSLCMIMAVVSFLGFVVENIWLSLTKGYMDNRNMCLPFLLGYGLAIATIFLLFGTPKQLVLLGRQIVFKRIHSGKLFYFLVVMLCVSVGEILLGTFVEKTCHFYWWDYTKLPLHITRYTSIPTSAGFSFLITLFMDYFFMPLMNRFLAWDYGHLCVAAGVLMVLLTADFLYNAYLTYRNKQTTRRWKINMTRSLGYRLLHS